MLYYYTCNPRVLNAQVRVRVSHPNLPTLTLTLILPSLTLTPTRLTLNAQPEHDRAQH